MAEQLDAGLLDPELDAAQRRRRSQAARAAAMGGGRLPRLRHWLWGRRSAEPVPAVLGVREPPKPGRRGICCSGGGVRSASFNLGALQALQAQPHRILQQSKYIAAVSGGSYIAAAFAMVAKVDGSEASDPDLVDDDAPPFHPGSPEEQYLRNRSTYMAPGALGKVRLAARVVLGMIVNLLFLGALLLLLGWALGWLYSEALYPALAEPGGSADTRNAGIAAGAVLVASTALGLLATVHGFERERWTRFLQAWAGRLLVVALLTALLGIALPELLEWLRDVKPKAQDGAVKGSRSAAAALGGTSAAALLAGTLLQLRAKLLDRRILRQSAQAVGKGVRGYVSTRVWPRLRSGLQLLLVAAVGPLLLGDPARISGGKPCRPGSGTLDRAWLRARGIRRPVRRRGCDELVAAPLLPAALVHGVRAQAGQWQSRRPGRGRPARLRSNRASLRVRGGARAGTAEREGVATSRRMRRGERVRSRRHAPGPGGDQLHLQPERDRRTAHRSGVHEALRGAARSPQARLLPARCRGDVRCGALAVHGQGDAMAAALPADARQRPAWSVGSESTPDRRGRVARQAAVLATPGRVDLQRAARPELRRREVPVRDRRRPLREPRSRRAAAPRVHRGSLRRRQRRHGCAGAG
ncbi:MAG: patatin-like phospholipase family protein [Thermoleophilaceae bacterium]|nr:patatin-like phospholipase family protein [Thermoleophilaceae bacterium]